MAEKSFSTSCQVHAAPESWSKYTTGEGLNAHYMVRYVPPKGDPNGLLFPLYFINLKPNPNHRSSLPFLLMQESTLAPTPIPVPTPSPLPHHAATHTFGQIPKFPQTKKNILDLEPY